MFGSLPVGDDVVALSASGSVCGVNVRCIFTGPWRSEVLAAYRRLRPSRPRRESSARPAHIRSSRCGEAGKSAPPTERTSTAAAPTAPPAMGPRAAINHSAAVCVQPAALRRQLLVKRVIEEQDLALRRARRQSAKLLPVVHDYNLGCNPFRRRGHTPPRAVSTIFCVVPGVCPGHATTSAVSAPRTQCGTFAFSSVTSAPSARISAATYSTACPGLRRPAQPRPDIVRQVAQLVQRIRVLHGGVAQPLHRRNCSGSRRSCRRPSSR